MTTWNKTGIVVGSLSNADIKHILETVEPKYLRSKFIEWLELAIKNGGFLTVSLPYTGKYPTVEE